MTLPSRHTIRNSGPGSLRPSTLPFGHGGSPQYWIFTKHFVSLKVGGQSGARTRNLRLSKQAALTTAARNNFKAAPWNDKMKINRALGHLCAHIGQTGLGEPSEDGEMNEMTLSSRHRIRNSSPVGLRPSTEPLGHGGSPQYWVLHFCYFQTADTGNRTPSSGVKGSGDNHYPRAPLGWHQFSFLFL